jgi:CRP-like cAMP-binding protein
MAVEGRVLLQFHPFSELAPEYVARVASRCDIQSVAKGKIVFQRGKNLSYLAYLLEGQVNLVDASFQAASLCAGEPAAEYALNELNPSKSSAVAAQHVKVLTVDRALLDRVMADAEGDNGDVDIVGDLMESEPALGPINYLNAYANADSTLSESDVQDWMSMLVDSPLFDSLPAANIQQLFHRFKPIDVARGDVVLREGDQGDFFYVIAIGGAKVSSICGTTLELSAGEYFGEEALVGDTTRNATVTMTSDGVLMRLNKADFIHLLQEPLVKYVEFDQLEQMGPQTEIIDVRLPVEHRHFCVRGSRNIALGRLREKIASLDPGITYVVTDDGGSRSKVAVQLLLQTGRSAVILNHSDEAY